MPWDAPVRDTGANGERFVPWGLNQSNEVWETVAIRDYPQKEQLMQYLVDGVSVFDFVREEYRRKSRSTPYRSEAFPGAAFPSRISKAHAEFSRKK